VTISFTAMQMQVKLSNLIKYLRPVAGASRAMAWPANVPFNKRLRKMAKKNRKADSTAKLNKLVRM
jgi:hypothetical protein